MEFEWDENKNLENIRNHDISFEQAVAAFDDQLALPLEDPEQAMKTKPAMPWLDCVKLV